MSGSGWRRWRDALAMGALAAFLGVAFTSALAGGRDPNYSLQPSGVESTDIAPGVDCAQLDLTAEFLGEPDGSADDRQFRRDVWRARRILGCDG